MEQLLTVTANDASHELSLWTFLCYGHA